MNAHDLNAWVFHRGMMFDSWDKWWPDDGLRKTMHEGLDLLLYADHEGRIARLDKNARIPVMLDGVVVSVINDFLGETVIVEHLLDERELIRFCTFYAHTRPGEDLCVGTPVNQGDVIATLAGPGRRPFPMVPHLHLSAGWIPRSVSYDRLAWDSIGDAHILILLDPLQLLEWEYRMLGSDRPIGRESRTGERDTYNEQQVTRRHKEG